MSVLCRRWCPCASGVLSVVSEVCTSVLSQCRRCWCPVERGVVSCWSVVSGSVSESIVSVVCVVFGACMVSAGLFVVGCLVVS